MDGWVVQPGFSCEPCVCTAGDGGLHPEMVADYSFGGIAYMRGRHWERSLSTAAVTLHDNPDVPRLTRATHPLQQVCQLEDVGMAVYIVQRREREGGRREGRRESAFV